MCNSLARIIWKSFPACIANFSHDNAITISCSLEVFFLGRLHYKNEIAVAQRSRWHLHIPFLVTGFPPKVLVLSLSLSFSLFLFFPSPFLSPRSSRVFSFPYIHAILTLRFFEWEGIIKRRTSNGGVRRNLIFRTKSIDSAIGRALTTISTEKAREREREDDAPKNSSYSGIRRPPRPND